MSPACKLFDVILWEIHVAGNEKRKLCICKNVSIIISTIMKVIKPIKIV